MSHPNPPPVITLPLFLLHVLLYPAITASHIETNYFLQSHHFTNALPELHHSPSPCVTHKNQCHLPLIKYIQSPHFSTFPTNPPNHFINILVTYDLTINFHQSSSHKLNISSCSLTDGISTFNPFLFCTRPNDTSLSKPKNWLFAHSFLPFEDCLVKVTYVSLILSLRIFG